jgi:membrane protease YdiL (CAAX protease family)
VFALSIAALTAMSGAFLIEIGDLWTRMVAAIAVLGTVGLGITWGQRRSLLRADVPSIALGLVSAAALYVVAVTLARFEPVARQAAVMNQWRSGHSTPFLVVTVAIAVVGEEIFWRAAFLGRMMRGLPVVRAALLAALVFAAAHVASGTWLLPLAALGAGFVWNLLYLATGNLTASFVSHLIWDLLVVAIAPLG